MDTIHIGIVGSRRRTSLQDRQMVLRLVEWLGNRFAGRRRIVIVSGGCPEGADHFAEFAAELFGIERDIYPIDKEGIVTKWEFTQRAFARNKIVAEKSDSIFCLVHSSRTGGTENTIMHALKHGTKVFLVNDSGEVYLSLDGNFPVCDAVANLLDLKYIA